ncbi:MAG: hypothetical protein PHC31_02735 [Clostridia bacterium]|nr:hypothetical protein [Clostridia bacterium]
MKSELLHWEKPKLVGIELQELAIEIAARATFFFLQLKIKIS